LTALPHSIKLSAGEISMTWQAELAALIDETMAHVKAMEGADVKPVVPLKIIERALAESPRSVRLPPVTPSSPSSERQEIISRVASFKAVQERMRREREDYCDRTLSVARLAASGKEKTADR
jgi:hypothetical protein